MLFLRTGAEWLHTEQGRRCLETRSYGPYSPHFNRKTPYWGLIKCSSEAWGIHRGNSSMKASEGSVRAGLCLGHWQTRQDMCMKKIQGPWRLRMENTAEPNICHPLEPFSLPTQMRTQGMLGVYPEPLLSIVTVSVEGGTQLCISKPEPPAPLKYAKPSCGVGLH